jgi:hypothetical protein
MAAMFPRNGKKAGQPIRCLSSFLTSAGHDDDIDNSRMPIPYWTGDVCSRMVINEVISSPHAPVIVIFEVMVKVDG